MRVGIPALALLLAAGCGGGDGSRGSEALDTTMGMGRVHRHSEMPGMLMLPRVRSHLDSLAGSASVPAGAALASHVDLTREMVETMERDRRDLAAWAGSAPGPAAVRAHLERVRRLLAMYQGLH